MKKNKAQIVIVRKDKKVHKGRHLVAFALTGGTSGIFTASQYARVGAYNSRTRKLREEGEDA